MGESPGFPGRLKGNEWSREEDQPGEDAPDHSRASSLERDWRRRSAYAITSVNTLNSIKTVVSSGDVFPSSSQSSLTLSLSLK